jgi:hypothetical protein
MKDQHSIYVPKPKATAIPCILGIAFFVLLGNAHAASQFACPFQSTGFGAPQLLESVALAGASQALQACILNQQHLLQSLAETVTALWVLLVAVAAALLLRAAFASKVGSQPAPADFSENS